MFSAATKKKERKKLEAGKVVDDPRHFQSFLFGKKNSRDGIVDWKSKWE